MMRANARRGPRRERGVALVLYALMVVAMMGILSLVIDLGLLFGQRRFDQNGADAAALAAGQLMASWVAPRDDDGNVYFHVAEAEVYKEVRLYAGLDPNYFASTVPTGANQNPGLLGRNALAVTLEYSPDGGDTWCYSPSGSPSSRPGATVCALPRVTVNGVDVYIPPFPGDDPDKPYKVRVTVTSITEPFIARVIGGDNIMPAPSTDEAVPACVDLRPTGATGNTTCAQAVVRIGGSAIFAGTGPVLPITTGDCQIAADSIGELFELWGSNPDGCDYNINPWKNMLDFTSENKWCDELSGGSVANPDYKYWNLLPISATNRVRAECNVTDPSGDRIRGWDRAGFAPDTTWGGTGRTDDDVPGWIARGFKGTIRASYTDGNKLPTYVDAEPGQGANLGQNIALGFYCDNTATETSCPGNPAGNSTYYFAKNQPGYVDNCKDEFFPGYSGGCRDAIVPVWGDDKTNGDVQWATGPQNQGYTGWASSGGSGPDRVRIVRFLNMRIYCEKDGSGLCTRPPGSITGSYANSEVWGLFLGLFYDQCPPGDPTQCSGRPTINGNVAILER